MKTIVIYIRRYLINIKTWKIDCDILKMKAISVLNHGVNYLKKFVKQTPEIDARILLSIALQSKKKIFPHDDIIFTKKNATEFDKLLYIRTRGKPISRILGERGFWKHDFKINSFTLDPRPDSELLIEIVLSNFKNKNKKLKILDLGSGSGCLGLSLAYEYPNSSLVCMDKCTESLKILNVNATNMDLSSRLTSLQGNWFDKNWTDQINQSAYFQFGFKEKFDIVVSNPPYLKSKEIITLKDEVKKYDPLLALDGGEDGCDSYKSILLGIHKILQKKGVLIMEIDEKIKNNLEKLVIRTNFRDRDFHKDLSGKYRALLLKNIC